MTRNPNHREAFGYWLNEAGLMAEGAEVGCAFGGFSSLILSQWKGRRLHMIDPWEKQPKDVYRENTDGTDYDGWFKDCSALAVRDPRAVILRKYSVDASRQFENGQLDWCYLDGNHSYVCALEDMDAWWPKVKVGGIMGLHDYYNNTEFPHFCEVENAVNRWAKQHEMVFSVSPCTSAWFYKWRE